MKMKKETAFEKPFYSLFFVFFFTITNLVAVVNSWHMVAALMLDEAAASWRNCYSRHSLEQKS
jgi:hypothetical protein